MSKERTPTIVYMLEAIARIKAETDADPEWEADMNSDKKGSAGIIECPKCGKQLKYSVAGGNHHIWGVCETEGCLKWMM